MHSPHRSSGGDSILVERPPFVGESSPSSHPNFFQTLKIKGVGPIFGVVVLGLTLARRFTNPWVTALIYLAVLTVGPAAYFVASFGAGMALADTYMISGADYSPWARPPYYVSLAAAVSLVAAAIVGTKKGRFVPPSDRVANATSP